MKNKLVLFLFSILSTQAFADVTCGIGDTVKGIMVVSTQVLCPDGVDGWIADETPVTSATVTYKSAQGTEATAVLSNPPANAQLLLAPEDPRIIDWVKSQLPPGASDIDLSKLTFSDTTPLYAAAGAITQPVSNVKGGPATQSPVAPGVSQEAPACVYLTSSQDVKNYITVKGELCSKTPMKFCIAQVQCTKAFEVSGATQDPGLFRAYCKVDPATDSCPRDPIDCFSDSSIDELEQQGTKFLELNGSGNPRALSR